MSESIRIEEDLLGSLPVPDHLYYGIHTPRAVANFQSRPSRMSRSLFAVCC